MSNLCGLVNIGNTCFMNAALQLLVSCTVLTKVILTTELECDKLNIYKKFLRSYMSQKKINPKKVKKLFSNKNKIFEGYQQHDSHEFLISAIDYLEELLNDEYKKKGVSVAGIELSELCSVIFGNKITSIIYSNETKEKSKNKITEKILSLELPNKYNITFEDCLEHFQIIENLDGDNKWFSEKHNKYVDAYKKLQIKCFAKYLIIHLKRFTYIDSSRKISSEVSFKETVILKNQKFELRGIIYHMGSTGGGHYISAIKRDSWYSCNDENISPINDINEIINNGYIYLYVKTK